MLNIRKYEPIFQNSGSVQVSTGLIIIITVSILIFDITVSILITGIVFAFSLHEGAKYFYDFWFVHGPGFAYEVHLKHTEDI